VSDAAVSALIVADVRLYREGISLLLRRDNAVSVAAAVVDATEARDFLQGRPADVVLVDATTPRGLESVTALVRLPHGPPVVALGVDDDDSAILACAEVGVAGYVTREGSRKELSATILAASRGELECSPHVAAVLLRRVAALAAVQQPAREPRAAPELTPREQQIVALLGEGLSNKEIASRLHIQVATVKNHVHRIIEKLHIQRRGEVAGAMRRRAEAAELVLG
jgi:DNA-binding NarL/FixJ family response regulator